MTADLIGKKQRLIEFPFTESLDVQGNGNDHIDGFKWREAVDHKSGKWHSQRNFPSVFKEADGVLKGRHVRIEGPGLGV